MFVLGQIVLAYFTSTFFRVFCVYVCGFFSCFYLVPRIVAALQEPRFHIKIMHLENNNEYGKHKYRVSPKTQLSQTNKKL